MTSALLLAPSLVVRAGPGGERTATVLVESREPSSAAFEAGIEP